MASDPQFGAYSNSSDPHSFQVEEPERKRSWWQTCLIGCLGVLAVMLVVAVVVGIWVSRNWRGWAAEFGSQAINQGIDSSDLPPQEKVEVKVQVERVAKAFRDGQISNEQASAIIKKLIESPLMPSFVVMAVERNYFDHSKLSDDEKAEGRKSLKRFARGIFDDKIKEKGIDAVMAHVAERKGDGQWRLRTTVSDDELRAALGEAKAQADAANIPAEPENIDPSDEVKRIIDESLNADHVEDSK
jgi:hypothetical protein